MNGKKRHPELTQLGDLFEYRIWPKGKPKLAVNVIGEASLRRVADAIDAATGVQDSWALGWNVRLIEVGSAEWEKATAKG